MLFNSVPFLMFFPAVLLVHFVLPRRVRWIWLLVASYYFYMCWNPVYALLMLTSTAVTYLSGLLIARCRVPEEKHGAGSALWHHPRIWVAVEPDHQPGHSVLLQVLPLCSGKPNGAAVEYGD